MSNNSGDTVPGRFKEAVARWGDKVALRKKEYGLWQDISWNDYYEKVRSVACALMSMGLERGDCAAIIGDNCPEWVFADMGIQCCGAAATGVYATNAWLQVEYVVKNSESKFFFVENEEQLDKWLHFKDSAPDILYFFQSIGVNLIEGYGQTEGTGVTTTSRIGRVKFGTVGVPLEGVEIKIADDGEILVKSPGVFKGYFKNPKSTAETIVDGWLYSGDVGEIDEDGYLKITDRKKDIIVTAGGKNITPQYLENKLKASLYINDAVVIGDRRKYLTCLIMIDEDNVVKFAQDHKIQFSTYKDLTSDEEINKLIDAELKAVNETLSRVEQVKKFTILPKKLYEEDGEMTPTMKVKRNFVNEAFSDLIEAMY